MGRSFWPPWEKRHALPGPYPHQRGERIQSMRVSVTSQHPALSGQADGRRPRGFATQSDAQIVQFICVMIDQHLRPRLEAMRNVGLRVGDHWRTLHIGYEMTVIQSVD